MVYTYNTVLFSPQKKWNASICSSAAGNGRHREKSRIDTNITWSHFFIETNVDLKETETIEYCLPEPGKGMRKQSIYKKTGGARKGRWPGETLLMSDSTIR